MKKQLISAIKLFIQDLKSDEDLHFTKTGVTINETRIFCVEAVNKNGVVILNGKRGIAYTKPFKKFNIKQLTRILIYFNLGYTEVVK